MSFLVIYDQALIFLFIFAITYGLLHRVKLIDAPSVNGLIALAVALITALSAPTLNFLLNFIPSVTVFIVILFLMFFLLLAAFIPTENIKDYVAHSGLLVSMIIAIILILALYTLYSLGAFSLTGTSLSSSSTPGFTLNPQFIISILTLVIMIAGVYFMTRKPNA